MKTSTNGRTSTRSSRPSVAGRSPASAEDLARTAETHRLASEFVEDSGKPAETERSVRQRIAERAYLLYLARGGDRGDALGDWLEAERQIMQEAAS